ncbi:uncharacterized protein LOC122341187 [Puntigrus tetrazona]|uniref:uncharacterized protein LOC122341187 n=1 Tax=Puntigrus tetrazona TaxID=1606681 RepID=UPI001C8B062E|nr:uncharacterized protein LOC122341187 [Puntigrus tetrazona]
MIKAGIIVEAPEAHCNTPIFPVRKADSQSWRMIQDLRTVNQAVESRAPCVPDPHTLLNQLKPEMKWFTVVDLSNAFFSIPVHKDSQGWFGFTYKCKKYTYTRLPQGFVDSPTIFSSELMSCLSPLTVPTHSQVLVYVDDILIASDTQEHNKEAAVKVFQHLAATGNKASLAKLQWAKQEVMRAVCAAALAVQASAEVVLFHKLTLLVPHSVDALLTETKMSFLSPARHLAVMSILMSQPHLTIKRCTTLNPSSLLPTCNDGTPHCCLTSTEQNCKPRPDLRDVPLTEGETLFVDGSCSKNSQGENQCGYAVVSEKEIVTAGKLPSHYSAQAAEVIALTKACQVSREKDVTIYTDSQYAFSTLHHFAAQWERRGMKTANGQSVKHAALLTDLLKAIQLPRKIAVCKCAAHTKGTDLVSLGNAKADEAAKQAAQGKLEICEIHKVTSVETPLDMSVISDMQKQAPASEKQMWLTKGAQLSDDTYRREGKLCLPRSLYKTAAILTHGQAHMSTGGMVHRVEQYFYAPGFNNYSKNFCKSCLICCKHNSQGNCRPKRGQFPKPDYPFQFIHMDFIELTPCQQYKYCMVDRSVYRCVMMCVRNHKSSIH